MAKKGNLQQAAKKEERRRKRLLWRGILKQLDAIQAYEPWQNLTPDQNFAYLAQGENDMAFCSFLQMADSTPAICIYPTEDARYTAAAECKAGREETRRYVETVSYILSFVAKDQLPPQLVKLYETLPADFGDGLWPCIESKEWGYFSTLPSEEDLNFLSGCLENLVVELDVLLKQKHPVNFAANQMLLRYYEPEQSSWATAVVEPAAPKEQRSTVHFRDTSPLLADLLACPTSDRRVEFDFGWAAAPVQDSPKDAPYYPLAVVFADRVSGEQLGIYNCRPEEFFDCALSVLKEVSKQYGRPETLYVSRNRCFDLMEDLASKAGMKFKQVKKLNTAPRILKDNDLL